MNAGYYVGKWVVKMIKAKGDGGAIKVIAAYIGTALAKKLVAAVVAGASGTKIGALLGAKLGSLAGPVGTFIVGLAGAL